MSNIALPRPSDEVLAKTAPEPISCEMAREVARLALAISAEELRRNGNQLSLDVAVPWEERPEKVREDMARGVIRVVQALQLLGFIEP